MGSWLWLFLALAGWEVAGRETLGLAQEFNKNLWSGAQALGFLIVSLVSSYD